jgi:DNA-binding protein HU-beta
MNKAELIYRVCEDTGLIKTKATAAVEAMLDNIQSALVKDDKVRLVGFGTFEVHHRASRKGRNPQTGDSLRIPPRKSPVFRAGRNLKKAVTNSKIQP